MLCLISKLLVIVLCVISMLGCSSTILPCFCGCHGSKHIGVLSESVDSKILASVHANTPDPRHEQNDLGQRLTIFWRLPKRYKDSKISGLLKVRFKTPKQVNIPFEVSSLKGNFMYQVVNDEYFSNNGILAYQVTIFINNEPVDIYQHKLWAELISFDESK